MPGDSPAIAVPAAYVGIEAIGFGTIGEELHSVTPDSPLPVATTIAAATSIPLSGSTGTTGTAGPFVPQLGRAIRVILSGNWTGTVQLLRSIDDGATRLPITYPDGSARGSWSTNINSRVVEESEAGATYYLAITMTAGTLSYRIAQ